MMEKELKALIKGELIGLGIEVIDAQNTSLIGKKGIVIDETRNMLVIKEDDTTRKLVKDQVTLKIKGQTVPGAMLCMRPEERIKVPSKKLNRITQSVKKNATKNKNKKPRK